MEKLFGLLGEKLGHTYSPFIHSEILKEIKVDGHYALFQTKRENLQHVVLGLKALSYNGINVTIPYKEQIIEYLDDLSVEAKKIRAVNVVHINNEGKAIGYNTDYCGFGMMLNNAAIDVSNQKIAILGTGGASKAVKQYVLDNGAEEIVFVSSSKETAKKKYVDDNVIEYGDLSSLKNYSIIINTTPVGMYPNTESSPVDKKHFKNFSSAVDLIYNPAETLFLKQAKNEGLKTVNGLYMLVAQAVKSQEIWNDIQIPDKTIQNIMFLFEEKGLLKH